MDKKELTIETLKNALKLSNKEEIEEFVLDCFKNSELMDTTFKTLIYKHFSNYLIADITILKNKIKEIDALLDKVISGEIGGCIEYDSYGDYDGEDTLVIENIADELHNTILSCLKNKLYPEGANLVFKAYKCHIKIYDLYDEDYFEYSTYSILDLTSFKEAKWNYIKILYLAYQLRYADVILDIFPNYDKELQENIMKMNDEEEFKNFVPEFIQYIETNHIRVHYQICEAFYLTIKDMNRCLDYILKNCGAYDIKCYLISYPISSQEMFDKIYKTVINFNEDEVIYVYLKMIDTPYCSLEILYEMVYKSLLVNKYNLDILKMMNKKINLNEKQKIELSKLYENEGKFYSLFFIEQNYEESFIESKKNINNEYHVLNFIYDAMMNDENKEWLIKNQADIKYIYKILECKLMYKIESIVNQKKSEKYPAAVKKLKMLYELSKKYGSEIDYIQYYSDKYKNLPSFVRQAKNIKNINIKYPFYI